MTARRTDAKLYRGLFGLLFAQVLVAVGILLLRQPGGVPPMLRAKAVAAISGLVVTAACGGWWLSQTAHRLSATSPATAVAGGLAASLIRLVVPLTLLGWLQTDWARELLSASLRGFLTETLITSYLFLLLVDILLHAMGSRPQCPAVYEREST
jgi:hypothetical protein